MGSYMRGIIVVFSLIFVLGIAGIAQSASPGSSDWGASFIGNKLILFGRLPAGSTWNGTAANPNTLKFGYRCYDSRNDLWKTVGNRTLGNFKVLIQVDMKCNQEDGYCADPKKDLKKAARTRHNVYSDCRPVSPSSREFVCELNPTDIPALCELNSAGAEKKLEQLFDEELYDIKFIVLSGKSSSQISPVLTYEALFEVSHSDADGDGIPDAWDNCPGTTNEDQKDSNSDGKGDVCQNQPKAKPAKAQGSAQ